MLSRASRALRAPLLTGAYPKRFTSAGDALKFAGRALVTREHAIRTAATATATAPRDGKDSTYLSTGQVELPAGAVGQGNETPPPLPSVGMDDRKVSVGWDGRVWSRYHHIWLRDHCRCSECFHPVTKQRLVDTFAIRPDIHPTDVQSTPAGLEVTWASSPTPHISVYPWPWLHNNSYDPFLEVPQPEKVLWGAGIQKDPPTASYDAVMQDDEALWKWLQKIQRFGFCFVNGTPLTAAETEALVRRVGFIRETHYGQFFEFTSDAAKGDTAYTTMALGAHTDGTYYTDPIGLQVLHLLSHTGGEGGASLLVDGFYLASLLRELHPRAYEVLARTRLGAHAAGEEGVVYRTGVGGRVPGHPIIRLNDEGDEVVQVRYNNDDRSALRLPADQVDEWYDALRLWQKTLTSPDSEYWVQLSPGTTLFMDNQRVLHGRSAFTGKRHMCGAYMGMDEFRSKLAVLHERFATPEKHAGRTWGGLI